MCILQKEKHIRQFNLLPPLHVHLQAHRTPHGFPYATNPISTHSGNYPSNQMIQKMEHDSGRPLWLSPPSHNDITIICGGPDLALEPTTILCAGLPLAFGASHHDNNYQRRSRSVAASPCGLLLCRVRVRLADMTGCWFQTMVRVCMCVFMNKSLVLSVNANIPLESAFVSSTAPLVVGKCISSVKTSSRHDQLQSFLYLRLTHWLCGFRVGR